MFRNAFRVQNFAQNYVQNSHKNSAKLNFSKFCQTLANVQKHLLRSKFRAKLCAKLPEKFCKTQFFKILPNVSKCSKTHIYKQNYAENSFKCLYELINH